MTESAIILYGIKLILGAAASFFAILVWANTHDAAWTAISAGVIISFAGIVYEFLVALGLITPRVFEILGMSFISFLFIVVPMLLIMTGFIIKFISVRK